MKLELTRNETQALAYAAELVREMFGHVELGTTENRALPAAHLKLLSAIEREELLTP